MAIQNTKEYIADFSEYRFDITKDRLFHFEIVVDKTGKTILLSKFHHIITDAWALSLIISEIIQIYDDLKNNVEISNEPFNSYTTFIEEENEYVSSNGYFKDQNYWNEVYSDEPHILNFKNSIGKYDCSAERMDFHLPKNISSKMKAFCTENKVSAYCFFLTCAQLMLSKKYGENDVIIGNPFLNRKNKREKETIGIFVNTLPVRLRTKNNQSILALLKENNRIIMGTLRHERYPYQDIQEFVKKRYSINQSLYNVLFSYQNAKDNRKNSEIDYSTKWVFNNNIADNMQIHVDDRDDEGTFNISIDYQVNIFDKKEILNLYNIYLEIIKFILYNKNKNVGEIINIDKNTKKVVLNKFNNKKVNNSSEYKIGNIYKLISVLNKKSDKIALEKGKETVSFKETFERVDKLSNYLVNNLKIDDNENIGIYVTKDIDIMIAILATINIGCTFVPIDVSYSKDRKQYMIDNANVRYLLTIDNTNINLNAEKVLDVSFEKYKDEIPLKKEFDYNSNKNLYIIYTSGSTGNPKPVTISHKNIINLIAHEVKSREFNFNNSRILQFANLSFDVSYQELFTSLYTGSTLVLIDEEEKKDSNKLAKFIVDNKISILFITPKYLIYLAQNELAKQFCQSLKYIVTAGEQLIITDKIKMLIDNGIQIHNHYGPAETHVATTYIINKNHIETKPPIGKAICNSSVYILNKDMKLCDIGVIGEMYISGDCVGNGYYNKEELTHEKFIVNPFDLKSTMYKTGDLAKYDENGNIYYIGRKDFQVKINGYRIEIEEVEKSILSIPEVKNVAVITEKDSYEKNILVSYIELNEQIEYAELKEKLFKKLPQYMIPNRFYLVDKMPININGKVDKHFLLQNKNIYQIYSVKRDNVLPENEIEAKILKRMEEVLNIKEMSVLDDFFEIGGDSLLAIALQVKLEEEGFVLNTQEIYDNPTTRKLCLHIVDKEKNTTEGDHRKINLTPRSVAGKRKNNILLTGATGYLGIHILNELLKNSKSKIYCLIRKKDKYGLEERLVETYNYYFKKSIKNLINKRVFVICGDMIQEHLGMKEDDYKSMLQIIDIVINSSASVKHYGRRDYNFEHNVVSTKNILEFIKDGHAILNHISTVGVSGNNLVDTNGCYKDVFSESDLMIGQKYSDNIYVSTKLQAEISILDSIKKNGTIANIIRVGNLMNRYSDYKFQKNKESNAFYNKVKEMIEFNYFPQSYDSYSFDLTPVDQCAEAICKLVFNNKYNNVYHVLNSEELRAGQIVEILYKLGVEISGTGELSQSDKEKSKWLINDIQLNNKKKIAIDSTQTQKILKKLGFEWQNSPKYYEEVFKRIIKERK